MLALFRRNNSKAVTAISPEETIQRLRDSIQIQEKREMHLEQKMKQLGREAKERLSRGDKRGAVSIMKKRKLYESEQNKIMNVKMTLETQAINLESAASTAGAFEAMKMGTGTMQGIRRHLGGVDNVDDLMMSMQEEFEMAEEVNNAIGQSVDPLLGAFDDDELMKELMDGETKPVQTQQKARPASLRWPTFARKDEEELRQLEAELAM